MIGGCILTDNYVMLADVWEKFRSASTSGQIKNSWQFSKTVKCNIATFSANSFRVQAITQQFGPRVKDNVFIKLSCAENLGSNAKITNIRSLNGDVLFYEKELNGDPATWFEVNGSSPVIDPFGAVIEWSSIIHRSELQGNG